jgi:hypothetical protein
MRASTLRLLLVPALAAVLFGVACRGESPTPPSTAEPAPSTPTQPAAAAPCTQDSDCVPAQCCHATSCTVASAAPACDDVACTMECRGGTMDCGGGCACQAGTCVAQLADLGGG